MGFETLLLIGLAGLAGPLLALSGRRFVPVVIGEIAAGVVIGRTGFGAIDPNDATTSFLAMVGFAMLMLTVGMHLPLRDPRLSASLREGAVLAAAVAVLAVPAGFAAAAIAGTRHAAIYAVVLASGSAAVLLPSLEGASTASADALTVMAQVTVADVATIVAVPIALVPSRTSHALLGGALVTATALLLFGAVRMLRRSSRIHRLRE
ncbi:MAG TPA: cation:proton antiporter, partial [Solirubrobacteraceae bacterium]|nr:cation:proton antiporter [Solirubrobacteraceae bacterium]